MVRRWIENPLHGSGTKDLFDLRHKRINWLVRALKQVQNHDKENRYFLLQTRVKGLSGPSNANSNWKCVAVMMNDPCLLTAVSANVAPNSE